MAAKEIRFHGRGGQGAVTAAKMLASSAAAEGKCVASFPMYGFERRGMPVIAFTRVDEKPIREKTQIYTPDCLMVIDPTLLGLSMSYERSDGSCWVFTRESGKPPIETQVRAAP